MSLLLDQNLSRNILRELHEPFPQSAHVYTVGLHEASDNTIWEYAREHELCIVTQDIDFIDLVALRGFPPKVIRLAIGNSTTREQSAALAVNLSAIQNFLQQNEQGILVIE